ncbi:hypothetical protein SAMN05216223_103343 [Actinacidiphila yanglinensis]|uniref:UL36 very large tegument protein n=1 Tax=Actinacidiphila yanglinensis TaxID=310779 RepID=A0A1H5XPA4_9ACTN|nr:hypothetical protein [Actinacidiphila yanglinensis]SEG13257.1 hypothetical protein SAMN05216223_103343 [Actinacidiphila yanglinensis]
MAGEFAYYYRSLLAALGERPGWYGVFAERDPEAAAAYSSGRQVPPWDVVRTMLRDVAANAGAADTDPAEAGRAYALHRAATAAEDAAQGAPHVLRGRLESAVRARDGAAARARGAARAYEDAGGASGPAAARLANGLAWARDDLARASARCEELRGRLTGVAGPTGSTGLAGPAGVARPGPADERPETVAPTPTGVDRPAEETVVPRRPTGARFAGSGGGESAGSTAEGAVPAAGGRVRSAAPRGARFAGAPAAVVVEAVLPGQAGPATGPLPSGARFAGAPKASEPAAAAAPARDPRWTAEAQAGAARLGALRRAGESGAAYLVLCAAAEGPADRIPYVVRELERTGLGADVATLLWEIAALPPHPLAEAVAALAADGRGPDCRTLLRQAAGRPPEDVAVVADLLQQAGRTGESGELLETLARSRPAATAAAVARTRTSLAEPLLAAAARVSRACRRDVSAALRG